ncbi:MAG: hypothetical protein ACFFA0_04005 [Promethearchaeota archaeon]
MILSLFSSPQSTMKLYVPPEYNGKYTSLFPLTPVLVVSQVEINSFGSCAVRTKNSTLVGACLCL